MKVMHGQLMVVCPHDGESFLLARIIWLMQEEAGGLIAGVATLPGMPSGAAVRVALVTGGNEERFAPAFLLPQLPAVGEEASIVLAPGMYQASRVLDVYSPEEDRHWQLRLLHILQRGSDFERVSYQPL